MKCTKAIIPVAGYGTRRLPVTKSIEKCMLPLLNRPIIDYVVDDCIRAGITDIYFIISTGATQLQSYYERNKQLEDYLMRNGKEDMLSMISPPEGIRFHYTEQENDGRYGTAIPVWLARHHIEDDEHVLVIMGDQCLYRSDKGSEAEDLIRCVSEQGSDSGMVTIAVPEDEVEKYGIVECDTKGNFVRIHEKPKRADAPSNLNNASFYLFNKRMFEYVSRYVQQHKEGEYLLTDPINEFVGDGYKLFVTESKGVYLDCGTVEGWVAANNYLLDK